MQATETDNTLGGRLALLSPDELTSDQKKLYNKLDDTLIPWAKKSGFQAVTDDDKLIGPFNPMLRSPKVSAGFLEALDAEMKHTTLNEKVRQVIILTVGAVWHCEYELYAHHAIALKAGFDETTIAALSAGQAPSSLTAEERTAQQFTHTLASTFRVDEQTYQQALDAFGEEGVTDMTYLASNYFATSALLNVFAVPAPKK